MFRIAMSYGKTYHIEFYDKGIAMDEKDVLFNLTPASHEKTLWSQERGDTLGM